MGRGVPLMVFLLLAARFDCHAAFFHGHVHFLTHVVLIFFFLVVLPTVSIPANCTPSISALPTSDTRACNTCAVSSITLSPSFLPSGTIDN